MDGIVLLKQKTAELLACLLPKENTVNMQTDCSNLKPIKVTKVTSLACPAFYIRSLHLIFHIIQIKDFNEGTYLVTFRSGCT